MLSDPKIDRLILQLTRATVKGDITWEVKPAPRVLCTGTDDIVPIYYEGNYKGQTIGLFTRRYQTFSEEYEKFFWKEGIELIFIDDQGRVIWQYSEQSSTLYNLFDVVRDAAANVDEILEGLLE